VLFIVPRDAPQAAAEPKALSKGLARRGRLLIWAEDIPIRGHFDRRSERAETESRMFWDMLDPFELSL
jgi:hypothetical protein